MEYLQVDELPELRKPTFIAAFKGWNDAGEAASFAVRHLIDSWSAKQFGVIDSEEFFDFTVTRPMVRITEEGQRDLQWPSNRFYYHRQEGDDSEGDVVLLLGTEPHLKWRAFTESVRDLYQRVDGQRLLTLGALVAATTHTRPPPVTGFSTEPDLQQRLESLTIGRSRYEGPTGIVGALHDAWRRDDLPAASLWVGLPPYLGEAVNPRGALALLQEMDKLFAFAPDLTKLEEACHAFEKQVDDALAGNAEMRAYLEQLEKRIDSGIVGAATPDLPPAGDLMSDLETYLKQQRKGS
ncbi:MAG: PAC2 family protein [Chloroflexi bacterium]|nr:PAC2 family protein [Chloroflexota bacterium]